MIKNDKVGKRVKAKLKKIKADGVLKGILS